MRDRRCPWCGEPLAEVLRSDAVWCSGRCRRAVSDIGGPLAAAEHYESLAPFWDQAKKAGAARDNGDELRARAAALRALDGRGKR